MELVLIAPLKKGMHGLLVGQYMRPQNKILVARAASVLWKPSFILRNLWAWLIWWNTSAIIVAVCNGSTAGFPSSLRRHYLLHNIINSIISAHTRIIIHSRIRAYIDTYIPCFKCRNHQVISFIFTMYLRAAVRYSVMATRNGESMLEAFPYGCCHQCFPYICKHASGSRGCYVV